MMLSKKSRAVFLTAVASGTMLNPLNSSMISLALHSIQHEFHLSFTTVSWLISSFYLASAVAQPVTGKLGDLIGRKRLFLFGLILVAVSAIGAPFAPTFMTLLVMRLFQSVGSSAIYPLQNHSETAWTWRAGQRNGAITVTGLLNIII